MKLHIDDSSAGNHTEMIKPKFEDFNRLVKPKILKFSEKIVSYPSEGWEMDY